MYLNVILLISIMRFVQISGDTSANIFKVFKNQDTNSSIVNSLIFNVNKSSNLMCAYTCSSTSNCLTAVFKADSLTIASFTANILI